MKSNSTALSTAVRMCMAALLVVVQCLPAQSKTEPSFEEVIARFDALATAFERIAASVPRDRIDVQGAVVAAGLKTPEMVLDWVKKETALVPYVGRLRGPLGVLDDRRGNSLDRSLLMAAMLKEIGLEARLARAQLTVAQAEQLLKTVGNPPPRDPNKALSPPENLFHDLGFDQNQIAKRRAERAAEVELLKLERDLRIDTHSLMIERLVSIDSKEIDEKDRRSDVRALRDHWWVQVKNDDAWLALDPSHGGLAEVPSAFHWFAPDAVPDNIAHKVRIRIIAETINDNRPSQTILLSKTVNAETASGQLIRLDLQGGGLTALLEKTDLKTASEIPVIVQQVKGWLPLLSIGPDVFADKGVTTNGEIKNSDDPIFLNDASLGSAITKSVGGFADILGGLGEEPQAAATGIWSALWIEFEYSAPNIPTEIERRVIFDNRIISESPSEGAFLQFEWQQKRAEILLGNVEISIQSSALSEERATVVISDHFLTAFRQLSGGIKAIQNKQSPRENIKSNQNTSPMLNLYNTSRFTGQNHTYLNRANIVITHSKPIFFDKYNGQELVMNVIFNTIGTISTKNRFAIRVKQGIRDTVVEDLALGFANRSTNITHQAFKYWETGVQFNLFDIFLDHNDLKNVYPEEFRKHFTSGYVVISPKIDLSNGEFPIWWRIDRQSGTTLGFGKHARGTSSVEYFMIAVNLAMLAHCGYQTREAFNSRNVCDAAAAAACLAGSAMSFYGLHLRASGRVVNAMRQIGNEAVAANNATNRVRAALSASDRAGWTRGALPFARKLVDTLRNQLLFDLSASQRLQIVNNLRQAETQVILMEQNLAAFETVEVVTEVEAIATIHAYSDLIAVGSISTGSAIGSLGVLSSYHDEITDLLGLSEDIISDICGSH